MKYILDALKKTLDFKGRARRKEYWWFILFYLAVGIALMAIDEAIGSNGILPQIGSLALHLTILSVSIRRLHDTNHRWWWILVPFIPIVFLFQDSQKGTNRFGENPKGINA